MGYPKFLGLWQAPLLIMVLPLNTDPDLVLLHYMVRIGIQWAHHSSHKGAKTSIKEGVLWTTIGLLFKVRMKTHMWKTVFYLLNMHAPFSLKKIAGPPWRLICLLL